MGTLATQTPRFRNARWYGVGVGLLLALGDTALVSWLGVSFALNGTPVFWTVVCFFGSSFGAFGFLLGWGIEARERDRLAAEIIREQSETIRRTRGRLAQAEKMASLGQLAAAIAHEVRNPLGVIRSAAQELADGSQDGDEELRQATSFMIAEIDRLTNVVTSLLSFAGPPRLTLASVTVEELLGRVELLAREESPEVPLVVRVGSTASGAQIEADFDLLCQVLLGLVENALEALGGHGEIRLGASLEGDVVVFSVEDDGPGIPPEIREKVFDPFFTTRSRGIGLGLAVAKQVIDAHGGSIRAGASASGGAAFELRLRAKRGAALAA